MALAGGRVLVVDHDPVSCDAIAYFLKSIGYHVATAPDGNRALNIGMDADIRLVILEARLPIYDGVEVLALLRRRYLARPVKVIAFRRRIQRTYAGRSSGMESTLC